jgi:hypothetical protein
VRGCSCRCDCGIPWVKATGRTGARRQGSARKADPVPDPPGRCGAGRHERLGHRREAAVIGDFSARETATAYQEAFERLLRDLKAESAKNDDDQAQQSP